MFLQAGCLLTKQFPGNVAFLVPVSRTVWEILISGSPRLRHYPWKQVTLSFLDPKSVHLHGYKMNWPARGIFCFARWSGNTCELVSRLSVTSCSSPTPFFLLKHCWGTGINDLTSKGRSIWTRHSLSQPGAAGSLVYPKYKAPGILETGRGSKTKLAGHSG